MNEAFEIQSSRGPSTYRAELAPRDGNGRRVIVYWENRSSVEIGRFPLEKVVESPYLPWMGATHLDLREKFVTDESLAEFRDWCRSHLTESFHPLVGPRGRRSPLAAC
jgi:hypothetical protein